VAEMEEWSEEEKEWAKENITYGIKVIGGGEDG